MNYQRYTLWSADDGSVSVELMENAGEDDPHIATMLSPPKVFDPESGEFRSVGFVPNPSHSVDENEDASDNPGENHTPCRTLFVNIVNGNSEKPISLAVSPLYSVADIKSMLHDILSIAPDQQALYYAEEQLDDNENLEAYQIEDEATVNAIVWQLDDTDTKETESSAQQRRPAATPHMDEPEDTEDTEMSGTDYIQSKDSPIFSERDILVRPSNKSSADPCDLNPILMRGLKRSSMSFPGRLPSTRKRKFSSLSQDPHNIQQSPWEHIRENGYRRPDTPTPFTHWHPSQSSGTNYDGYLPARTKELFSLEDDYNNRRLGESHTTAHPLTSLSSGTQQPLATLSNLTTYGRPNYHQTSIRGSQFSSDHDGLTDGFLSRKDRSLPEFGCGRNGSPSRIHKSAKSPYSFGGDPPHGLPMDYIDRRIASPTPARLGGASSRDAPAYETGDYPVYDFARDNIRYSKDYIPSFSSLPPPNQLFTSSSCLVAPDYIPTFETQRRMLQDNSLQFPATETYDQPFAPSQPNYFPEYTFNSPSSFISTLDPSTNHFLPRKESVTLLPQWSTLSANDSVAPLSFAKAFPARASQQVLSHRSLNPADKTHEDDHYPSRHPQSYASRLSETFTSSDYTSPLASSSTLPPLAQDILPVELLGARTVQQLIELQGWKMSAQEWREVRNALEGDREAQRNIQVLSAKLAGHGHINIRSHGRD
ncbi:hypothetical protein ACMFMG_008089 [Clarireedia jacksonii]